MLEAMIADGRHRPLIDSIIRWAGLVLEDNEDMVRAMINQRANALLRFTGLDERLANSVLDGLYRMLAEVLVDPEHPLRAKIEDGLADLAQGSARGSRDAGQGRADEARDARQSRHRRPGGRGCGSGMRHRLIAMVRGGTGDIPGRLTDSLAEMGAALRDDPRLQQQVNRFARRTAVGVTSRYGGQIVQLVSETVRGWDASTITGRVERRGRPRPPVHPHQRHAGGRAGGADAALPVDPVRLRRRPGSRIRRFGGSLHLETDRLTIEGCNRLALSIQCRFETSPLQQTFARDLVEFLGARGPLDMALGGNAVGLRPTSRNCASAPGCL